MRRLKLLPPDLVIYDTDRGEPLNSVYESEVDRDYHDRGTLAELDAETKFVQMSFD